jgi:hypothetical protein
MRNLVLALGMMAASGAFAVSPANHYECVGDRTSVTVYFGPGGVAPNMSVVNLGLGGGDTREESLDNVKSEKSPMGLLITGRFLAIADAKLTFTLIVPVVGINQESVSGVEGLLVRSLEGTMPLPDNAVLTGPRQHNEFRPVSCVASIVRLNLELK